MNGKCTISSRNDAAYPHKVIADPTGNFVLAPDLGADLIRLYSINNNTGSSQTVKITWKLEELALATMLSEVQILSILRTSSRTASIDFQSRIQSDVSLDNVQLGRNVGSHDFHMYHFF
jgi:hypothetical protein